MKTIKEGKQAQKRTYTQNIKIAIWLTESTSKYALVKAVEYCEFKIVL